MNVQKRNVPSGVIENCKCYDITKRYIEDKEYFVFDTKVISEYNDEDPLDSKVYDAQIFIKPEVLKKNFAGVKPSELKGKNFDIYLDFMPFTRSFTTKSGVRAKTTEWRPFLQEINYSGETVNNDSEPPYGEEETL
jgi:hypothetical protein